MADVGSAFVTLMPSMRGFASQINAEFSGINLGSQGTRIGSEFGDGVNSGFSKASTGATGFSGKMAALGGAVAGVASNIAGSLIDSVVGLAGEMVSAADGAQKFASTLSFAGIDDSTIKQLTASTQAYADQTVYDLNDIRNVTAQLAANGVNDYATLAEAAGNLNAVAGGNADTFKSVGMVLTQTAGSGKLMTENWNQLTDAIPGASGALQEAMRNAGAFEGNFREAMENGEISADEFFAAVQQLGMQDVAIKAATSTSTIEGALGNLQASVTGVGSQVITALTPAITGAMTMVSGAISQLPTIFSTIAAVAQPALQPIIAAFQNMATVIAPVILQVASMLMPALTSLGTALGSLASAVIPVIAAAIQTVSPIIAQIVSVVGQLVNQIIAGVTPAINNIAAIVQAVLPAIQNAFQIWGTYIQNVINAVFPFIQTVIQTVMDVINSVISTVLALVQGDWEGVWSGIQSIASSIWNGVQNIISSAINAVLGVIQAILNQISSIWSGAWNSVKSLFSSIWDGIKSAASAGIDAVVSTVTGIKDKIVGFFSGAGQWLADSGRAILDGLSSGIRAGFDAVTGVVEDGLNFIRGLFPFSPAKRGPFSGHGYTTFSGKALMGDFADSIRSQAGKVAAATESVLGVAQRGLSARLTTTQSISVAQPRAEEPTTREVTMNFYGKTESPDEIARMMRLNERYGFAGSY